MSERGTWSSGAIALALLIALTLGLAPNSIERDISRRALATLRAAGHDWSTIKVSGRDVTLFGEAPDDLAAAAVVDQLSDLWGLRVVHDQLGVSSLRLPEGDSAPAQSPPVSGQRAMYTPREQAALAQRLSPETCQQLFDGLLATRMVEFESASAVIAIQSIALLEHLVTAAVHCPDSRLLVAGHTDDSGSRSANHRLSEERARAVAEYLISRGVRQDRLTIIGHGAQRPVADNATAEGRALNQRIEITVRN